MSEAIITHRDPSTAGEDVTNLCGNKVVVREG